MESHVLRPMMTALTRLGEGGVVVTFLKWAMSPERDFHGCMGITCNIWFMGKLRGVCH